MEIRTEVKEITEIRVQIGKGTDSMAIAMMEKGFETNGYYFKKWEGNTVVFSNDEKYRIA